MDKLRIERPNWGQNAEKTKEKSQEKKANCGYRRIFYTLLGFKKYRHLTVWKERVSKWA